MLSWAFEAYAGTSGFSPSGISSNITGSASWRYCGTIVGPSFCFLQWYLQQIRMMQPDKIGRNSTSTISQTSYYFSVLTFCFELSRTVVLRGISLLLTNRVAVAPLFLGPHRNLSFFSHSRSTFMLFRPLPTPAPIDAHVTSTVCWGLRCQFFFEESPTHT